MKAGARDFVVKGTMRWGEFLQLVKKHLPAA
jgi:hypothetical protein